MTKCKFCDFGNNGGLRMPQLTFALCVAKD